MASRMTSGGMMTSDPSIDDEVYDLCFTTPPASLVLDTERDVTRGAEGQMTSADPSTLQDSDIDDEVYDFCFTTPPASLVLDTERDVTRGAEGQMTSADPSTPQDQDVEDEIDNFRFTTPPASLAAADMPDDVRQIPCRRRDLEPGRGSDPDQPTQPDKDSLSHSDGDSVDFVTPSASPMPSPAESRKVYEAAGSPTAASVPRAQSFSEPSVPSDPRRDRNDRQRRDAAATTHGGTTDSSASPGRDRDDPPDVSGRPEATAVGGDATKTVISPSARRDHEPGKEGQGRDAGSSRSADLERLHRDYKPQLARIQEDATLQSTTTAPPAGRENAALAKRVKEAGIRVQSVQAQTAEKLAASKDARPSLKNEKRLPSDSKADATIAPVLSNSDENGQQLEATFGGDLSFSPVPFLDVATGTDVVSSGQSLSSCDRLRLADTCDQNSGSENPPSSPDAFLDIATGTDVVSSGQSLSSSDRLRLADTCDQNSGSENPPSSPVTFLDIATGTDVVSSDQSLSRSDRLRLAEGPDFASSDLSAQSPRGGPTTLAVAIASETSAPPSPAPIDQPQQIPAPSTSGIGRSGPSQRGSEIPGGEGETQHKRKKKKKKQEQDPAVSSSNESSGTQGFRKKLQKQRFPFKFLKTKRDESGSSSDYRQSSSSSGIHSGGFGLLVAHSSSSDSMNEACGGPYRPFVNADTLHRSNLYHGIHVHSTLVMPQGAASFEDMTAAEILDKLSSGPATAIHTALKRTLLSRTLPRAERRQDLVSVSLCLGSSDQYVRRRAGESLEKMLMEELKPQQSSADMMMKVMKRVWNALNNSRHDQKDAISQYSHLLLLAACVLLCHHNLSPNAVSVQEDIECSIHQKLSEFMKGCELNKTSREFHLLKGVQDFFKDVPAALKSRLTFHEADWERCLQNATRDWTTDMDHKLQRANFAQLIQVTFSLTKEVRRRATESYVWILTREIKRTLKVVTKRSLNEHRSATFHFFLVRCLRLIITICFREDQQEIGEETCVSAGKIAKLLTAAVKNASARYQEMLQDEIRNLSFHQSDQVRKEMKQFARDTTAMVELSLSYAEDRLYIAGLRPQRIPPKENTQAASVTTPDKKQFGCSWHKHDWRGEEDKSAALLHGAMCHPTQKCLASASAHDCIKHAEPQQRNQQHQNHLRLLLELGDHEHFLRLLAFQISPRPCFYITENVSKRLTSLLINARNTRRWLKSVVLLGAAKQIAVALEFLASKGIALRDVTTFNMVCLPNTGKHGEVKDVRVKLADLGLADEFLSTNKSEYYENRDIRRQRDPGPIPVRWTSREALFEGIFSSASMVYAFGYVLYELFTHGCWPYTEMWSRSTEDILQVFYLQSQCVRVFQWPCFSDDVYKLIRQCTEMKSADRPDIKSLPQSIQTLLDQEKSKSSESEAGGILKGNNSKDESYPPISQVQRNREHVPENEIPMVVHQLMKGDPNGYKNLRLSSWSSPGVTAATEAELIPVDQCSIECLGSATIVQEQFTKEYVKRVLPDVESGHLPGLAEWISTPTISATDGIHRRQYEPSMTLLQAAIRLGPDRSMEQHFETRCLLHVLLELATVVQGLHALGWLHCDLRASYVLLTSDTCKVIIGRIGRMLKLPPGRTSVLCPSDYRDSTRWCAPEVLQNRIVCKASDVFMLGTVIWEVFNARRKCRVDPTAESSPSRLVPFPDAKSTAVPDMVQEGVLLPAVLGGEEFGWVNQLIYNCRNPDCNSRPSIDEVVDRMKARCTLPDESVSTTFRRSASVSALSYSSDPPVPPKRLNFFQTFRKSIRRTVGAQPVSSKKDKKGGKNKQGLISKAIAATVKRKGKGKNEDVFYELGYIDTSSEIPKTSKPSHNSRETRLLETSGRKPLAAFATDSESDVYDEIPDCGGEEEDTVKKSQVVRLLPPLPSHPPPRGPLQSNNKRIDAQPASQTKPSSLTPVPVQNRSEVPPEDDDDLSPVYNDPQKNPAISKTPPSAPSEDAKSMAKFPSENGFVALVPRAHNNPQRSGHTSKPSPAQNNVTEEKLAAGLTEGPLPRPPKDIGPPRPPKDIGPPRPPKDIGPPRPPKDIAPPRPLREKPSSPGQPESVYDVEVVTLRKANGDLQRSGLTSKQSPASHNDTEEKLATGHRAEHPPSPPRERASSPGKPESSKPKLKPATRSLSQRLPMPLPGAASLQTNRNKPAVSSYGDPVCPDPRKPLTLFTRPPYSSAQSAGPSSVPQDDGTFLYEPPDEIYDDSVLPNTVQPPSGYIFSSGRGGPVHDDSVYDIEEIYEESNCPDPRKPLALSMLPHYSSAQSAGRRVNPSAVPQQGSGRALLAVGQPQSRAVERGMSLYEPDDIYDDSTVPQDDGMCSYEPPDEIYDDSVLPNTVQPPSGYIFSSGRGGPVHDDSVYDVEEIYDDGTKSYDDRWKAGKLPDDSSTEPSQKAIYLNLNDADELYDDCEEGSLEPQHQLSVSNPGDADVVYDDCWEAGSLPDDPGTGPSQHSIYLDPDDADVVYDDCEEGSLEPRGSGSLMHGADSSSHDGLAYENMALSGPRHGSTGFLQEGVSSDEGYEPVGTRTSSGLRSVALSQPSSSAQPSVNADPGHLLENTSHYQNVPPDTNSDSDPASVGADNAYLGITHHDHSVPGEDGGPVEGSMTTPETYVNITSTNIDPAQNPTEFETSDESKYYLTAIYVKSKQK